MEARLFEEGTTPEWTTPGWYDGRETAPHLEQAGHRERLLMAANMIRRVSYAGPVLDLGAGDGGLLSLLDMPGYGYDLQQTNVEAAATRGVDVRYGNVLELDPIPPAHVVVVTEMLEHLVDPHGLLRRIHASGPGYLVASSPYTETPESHYEFHTWCWDLLGYRQMIEAAGFTVLEQGTAWICQIILAQRS